MTLFPPKRLGIKLHHVSYDEPAASAYSSIDKKIPERCCKMWSGKAAISRNDKWSLPMEVVLLNERAEALIAEGESNSGNLGSNA